ncbi:hypothetical protein BBO99_00009867 [Phytophthora kernoviae]|uniref:Peptidase S1 domain-containing protein n=1 Tax=Phytophthora kernoviae TaxID=325452 RepID=A0A3R7J6C5_9STRA|nr:hypothetical protein JM18_009877 [Phytophthora kernoviae]RLN27226.1 hypothetical protein BBI17_009925 [Phytophthora kernoviae]RLN72209.1 hypothetical protein BBO99_00009867 [Phytophthora kernoviae]
MEEICQALVRQVVVFTEFEYCRPKMWFRAQYKHHFATSSGSSPEDTVTCAQPRQNVTERKLIVGGEVVPRGIKTYTSGLRATIDGNSFCSGSLISLTHVLTASHCLVYDIRRASIGSPFRNGTQDGERVRMLSIMTHPNYSENVLCSDDFMVVELARPSSFNPVQLTTADDSDFEVGKWATAMGWGTYAETGENYAYELQCVDIQLASDEACANCATVNSTMVCAGGILGKDSCGGDSRGLLILDEGNSTKDVLIGSVSWAKDDTYAREGYYGVYSRVSIACTWIDPITGGNGTCL